MELSAACVEQQLLPLRHPSDPPACAAAALAEDGLDEFGGCTRRGGELWAFGGSAYNPPSAVTMIESRRCTAEK